MVERAKKLFDDEEDVLVDGLEDFVGDPEKEIEGTWRPLNDGTGREFLIAHGENPKFQAKLMRLMQPRMVQLKRRDENAIKLQRHLTGKAMAGTVLLDWRGGKLDKTPFDPKVGEKLLIDPRYRKLRSQIEDWADVEEAVIEDAKEQAVKNS